MSTAKLFMFAYFAGAAIFALSVVVLVLALLGVETVGNRIDLTIPVIGGFILMMGSKFAAAAAMRKAEKQ